MKYVKVPAAEKYAEGPRERCECHDEEMYWSCDGHYPGGGRWKCAPRRRYLDRERDHTDGVRPHDDPGYVAELATHLERVRPPGDVGARARWAK
ncbi:MAG: hypothetical protein M3O92_00290 [Actinomycetota bacterium]|nr:hypothetical protein [Actinomycetota bacterium]